MRGCKTYGGQPIQAGAIIYRQLGTKVGIVTGIYIMSVLEQIGCVL